MQLKILRNFMFKKQAISGLMLYTLSACSLVESQSGLNEPPLIGADLQTPPSELVQAQPGLEDVLAQLPEEQAEPATYEGTDVFINTPPVREAIQLLGEDVNVNFEQAPLMEVVQAIMGDILELDYIIDVPIPGEVTLRTRTPVPRSQLLAILESLLESRQASIVRLSDGRYFITGSEAAFRISPTMSSVDSRGIGSGIIVVPLQYISARDMADILSPVIDPASLIRVDQERNLLMLAGTRIQVDGWLDIISSFEVDRLAGLSVGIYPIEYAEVGDIKASLEAMLDGTGEEGSGGLLNMVRIEAMDDLNSLMVVTPRSHYLKQVETWIDRLDQPPSSGIETELFVYPVQNRSVGELAELLTKIYGGENTSDNGAGVAPGMTPQRVSSSINNSGSGNSNNSNNNNNNNNDGDGTSSYAYNVGDARVVADEGNNSLLIYATGRDYRRISRALEKLDAVPTQVLIEASIIEVSLSKGLQYGIEWAFDNELGGSDVGLAQLKSNSLPSTGFGFTVTNALTTNVKAVLKALAGNSLLNVISTPSLMVLDNYTAKLEAGSSVPYNAGSFVNGGIGNVITNNIAYRDIGVKLEVTPTVNAGGLVTMKILQSVTNLGAIEEVTGQRQFDERSIESQVAVRSGETVVLGGLIRDDRTETKGGIPFLYNLPLVGALFGTTDISSKQTELVVLITPTVIYSDEELREVSDNYRLGIRNLDLIDLPE